MAWIANSSTSNHISGSNNTLYIHYRYIHAYIYGWMNRYTVLYCTVLSTQALFEYDFYQPSSACLIAQHSPGYEEE